MCLILSCCVGFRVDIKVDSSVLCVCVFHT